MDAVDLEKLKRWHRLISEVCGSPEERLGAWLDGVEIEMPLLSIMGLREIEAEMRAMLDFEGWSHAREAGEAWHPSLESVKASLRDFPASDETAEEWAVRRLELAPCPTLAPHCDPKAP